MSTCAQACEHDTQSAHDAACSHAAVPVDVSSTAHCWFGTSSGVLHRCSPCPRFSLPKTTSPKGPSQTKIVERVSGRAKTASVARAQHAPQVAAQGASIAYANSSNRTPPACHVCARHNLHGDVCTQSCTSVLLCRGSSVRGRARDGDGPHMHARARHAPADTPARFSSAKLPSTWPRSTRSRQRCASTGRDLQLC